MIAFDLWKMGFQNGFRIDKGKKKNSDNEGFIFQSHLSQKLI